MHGLLRPRTRRDESGASAVEYSLLLAGVAALIVLIVFVFGSAVNNKFHDSCTTIQAKAAPSASC